MSYLARNPGPAFTAPPARQGGSLQYAQFVNVIKHFWEQYHPDIPIHPYRGEQRADYPSIVFRLERREPVRDEPKPKQRLNYASTPEYIITGQRFFNIVSFSAMTKNDPEQAEAIIEEFENFMFDITPALKQLGTQEIFYNRRFLEKAEERGDQDVAVHTIAYSVITEKIRTTKKAVIEQIIIDARIYLDEAAISEPATPNSDYVTTNVVDTERDRLVWDGGHPETDNTETVDGD